MVDLKLEIEVFQSPRSGKFVSDSNSNRYLSVKFSFKQFQSPRSGKFVSDIGDKGIKEFKLGFVSIP